MPPRAASATRALARTETFMPMKPADAEAMPPIAKPIATVAVLDEDQGDEQHDADDADRRVLAAEVRRGALLDGRRQAPAWWRCPGDSASSDRVVSSPYAMASAAHTSATTTP